MSERTRQSGLSGVTEVGAAPGVLVTGCLWPGLYVSGCRGFVTVLVGVSQLGGERSSRQRRGGATPAKWARGDPRSASAGMTCVRVAPTGLRWHRWSNPGRQLVTRAAGLSIEEGAGLSSRGLTPSRLLRMVRAGRWTASGRARSACGGGSALRLDVFGHAHPPPAALAMCGIHVGGGWRRATRWARRCAVGVRWRRRGMLRLDEARWTWPRRSGGRRGSAGAWSGCPAAASS